MRKTIIQMAQDIVVREAGLVDDKSDRGGITNHGVSLKYLRGKGLQGDLNHDGVVDAKDIIECTVDEAVCFFIHDFYESPQFDQLPECLHALMFDMAVMSGTGGAGMVLQNALNDNGYGHLTVDGGCGKNTRLACEKAHLEHGDAGLIRMVIGCRVRMLYEIAIHDQTQQKYVMSKNGGKGGWITRTESFLL